MRNHLLFYLFIGLLLNACYYDNEEDLFQYVDGATTNCDITTTAYAADVLPILTAYCTRCHRDGRTDGNVNLEGYNRVAPYASNGSLLGAIRQEAGFAAMPPSGGRIPACDLQKITNWVEAGAPNN